MYAVKEGDLYLAPSPDGGEISFEGGQPLMEDALNNALYISLIGDSDFWGNTLVSENEVLQGSIFDVLNGATLNNQTRLDLIAKAEFLLAWLVREGVMKSVSASAFIESAESVKLTLTLTEPNGQATERKYRILWTNEKARLEVV